MIAKKKFATMSNTIHMETEIVRDFALSYIFEMEKFWEEVEDLNKKVQNIPWEGVNSAIYQRQFWTLSKNLEKSLENISEIFLKVTREVDGWISVDQRNAGEYLNLKSSIKTGGDLFIEEFLAPFTTIYNDIKRIEFNNWWKTLSQEERMEFIKKEHEKIARSLGMESVPIEIQDFSGSADSTYNSLFGSIRFKSSLLDEKNGYQILSLIAHETRHQYQHDCVAFYEQTGNAPEGISVEQVIKWKGDFENYISINDDPTGYYNQSVEKDAYSFGDNYEKEYLNQGDEPLTGSGGW